MDRFDEEALQVLTQDPTWDAGQSSTPVTLRVAAWGRKLYAEGQASKTAEVDALKEKVGRMEELCWDAHNAGCKSLDETLANPKCDCELQKHISTMGGSKI